MPFPLSSPKQKSLSHSLSTRDPPHHSCSLILPTAHTQSRSPLSSLSMILRLTSLGSPTLDLTSSPHSWPSPSLPFGVILDSHITGSSPANSHHQDWRTDKSKRTSVRQLKSMTMKQSPLAY
ncbi:hypothetical protein Sjap_016227 [Stephania japonica]|uniref:Uncharacterized protein n=1 Tax=Stephania japonica TaxID=461633 RepID=A0AAP0NTL1_9MAGN